MYCLQQDLIDRFGEQELIELTDENNVEQIDATRIARAIADVDGIIDGYLGGRYQLPLSEIPKSIKRAACDLVRYDLYDNPTEQVEKRKVDAMQFLRDVSKGTVNLGINTDGSEPQKSDSASMTTSGNVFNRDDNGFM